MIKVQYRWKWFNEM